MKEMPINTAFKDSVTCNRVTSECLLFPCGICGSSSEVKVTQLQLHSSKNPVSMGFDVKFKCNPINY